MQGVLCRLVVVSLLAADVIAYNKRYYESCVDTVDCVNPFLCRSSLCSCDTNQTVSSDHALCLLGIKYGDPCRETGQCLLELADTYCGDSNHCECAPGYGYDPATSSCSIVINGVVPYGGKCRLDKQCKTGMICPGQTCECKTGLQYDRTSFTCIPIVVTRAPGTCSTNAHCTQYGPSVCQYGGCVCQTGYVSSGFGINLYCIQATRAPGTCSIDAHCTQYGPSVCQYGNCVCQTGYVSSGFGINLYCIQETINRNAGTCNNNKDCRHIRNMQCRNGNCVCRAGTKFTVDPQKGYICSAGTGLTSMVWVALLSLLLSKVAS